jgi:hypothetical protein
MPRRLVDARGPQYAELASDDNPPHGLLLRCDDLLICSADAMLIQVRSGRIRSVCRDIDERRRGVDQDRFTRRGVRPYEANRCYECRVLLARHRQAADLRQVRFDRGQLGNRQPRSGC